MIDKQLIKDYIGTEENLVTALKDLKEKQVSFNEENKQLLDLIRTYNDYLIDNKDKLKVQGLEEYIKTGQKQLTAGLGVRISKTLEYETSDAITWAGDNMKVAIKTVLDKKMFESHAKENKLEFVKINEKVIITFPKELRLE